MRNRLIVAVFFIVALVTIIPFAKAVNYGFVNFDDYPYRFTHEEVKQGLCLSSLSWAFSSFQEAIWMPLTWMSYMMDVTLYGGSPGGMHLHSILIHALNSGLLFLLLVLICGKADEKRALLLTALAALFWAVHPLRVESAVWIAARKDVLCLFWELLALIFWVLFLKIKSSELGVKINNSRQPLNISTGSQTSARFSASAFCYFLSILCLLLASFCKPSVMSFPFLAVALDIFILPPDDRRRTNWKHYIFPTAFAILFGMVSMQAQSAGGGMRELSEIPLWWRFINAATSYGLYLFHTVYPVGLAIPCYSKWPEMPRFMYCGILITSLIAAYALWRVCDCWPQLKRFERVHNPLLGCVLFFTLGIAPFLGIANFGFQSSADRFTYVPSLAISIYIVLLIKHITSKVWLIVSSAVLPAAVLGLGVVAHSQTAYWENDLKLFSHVIEVDGEENFVAYRNLASYYFEVEHNPLKVVEYIDICKQMDWVGAGGVFSMYIIALCELGEKEKANEALREFMKWTQECLEEGRRAGILKNEREGRSIPLLQAVTAVSILNGEYDLAEMHLKELYRHNPEDVFADYLKGHMLKLQGNEPGAMECWSRIADNRKNDFFWFRWMKESTVFPAFPRLPD